jgi:PAS domain S-box-containing protein
LFKGFTLHYAPISIFIVCELLLFGAGHLMPVPDWLHLATSISLATVLFAITAAKQKREGEVRTGLQAELSGMQQEIAKSARRYKSLLEGAGNAIFVFNADSGALEEANRIGMELLGYDREELVTMIGRDLLPASEHEKFRSFLFQIKRRGRADTQGLQFQRKNGSLFIGDLVARLIDLGDEQVVHCIIRDITEKKLNEREIRQRNRELSILNNILVNLSRGYEQEKVQETTLMEIMDLFQASGGVLHLIGEGGAPAELCTSRHVSRELERLIRDCVTHHPADFREIRVQEEYPGDEIISRAAADGWWSLTAIPLTAQNHLVGVMHLMHMEPHRYGDGDLRFFATVGKQMGHIIETARLFAELSWKSAELLRSHRLLEKTSHSLSVSENTLKRNLALVEQANLDLSRLDRMKNQFLGMVSHEFNTPLTSIISGVDLLLQQPCDPDQTREVLHMVRDGGTRLKELVSDLLRLIRLEARSGELERSVMHLESLMEDLKHQFRPQLEERKQSVKLNGLEDLPFFDADSSYLERVFSELISNAIKFSPEGAEIEVSGRVTERFTLWERRDTLERFNSGFLRRCGDRCYLEVEVRDQGTGIPADDHQRIFDIFYEVGDIKHHSSSMNSVQGRGAGLGLAIVKGMVEAHGGMVWVENTGGSSFFLLLPLEQEATQPELF